MPGTFDDIQNATVIIGAAGLPGATGSALSLAGSGSASTAARSDHMAPYEKILTAPQNITSSTATAIAGMSLAIAANDKCSAEFHVIFYSGTATGGLKFSVSTPASPSALRVVIEGTASGPTTTTRFLTYLPGTLSDVLFNTAAYQDGIVHVYVGIVNGLNAGTIQLNAASGVNGQQFTIQAGTYLAARKIA